MADYTQLAHDIIRLVGGESNIISLAHCITRLRFRLNDESRADEEALKKLDGVIKVMRAAGQYQVVIGQEVDEVYEIIMENYSIQSEETNEAEGNVETELSESKEKNSFMSKLTDTVSGIFMPFMGAFAGAGLVKGLLVLLTTFSLLDSSSTTYTILYAGADAIFYFLPIFLAYCAGKKFNAKPFVSMAIAAAMCYPTITALYSAGEAVTFIGIPVKLISYTSSVLPILVTVYLQSKIEKIMIKIFPKMLQSLFIPVVDLMFLLPLSLIVIGPITDGVSTILANLIQAAFNFCPPLAGFVLAAFWPIFIVFGVHWGFVPIIMNNFAVLGYDYISPCTFGANFGIAAACLAVFLKSRSSTTKQLAGSASVSALVGGVTEPGIYGVLMKNKKVFAGTCLVNGIGGVIVALTNTVRPVQISINLLTIPAVFATCGPFAIAAMVVAFIGSFLLTYFFTYKEQETI